MNRLAALILCLSLVAEAAPSSAKGPRGRASAVSAPGARPSPAMAPPAGPWVVDIRELVPSLRPLPQKEVEDQLRDWALYGLLMRLELGADELARTTHQLAPMRLPYLEELFAFEYGRGRRAILSDERVLLLYERGDPDPQATLGRLADRVRMELGRVPSSFELYTVAADVEGGELRLEFQEAVSGLELFTQKYGYSQKVVANAEELARWLGGVDDVVYAAQVAEGLRLGGRRFEKSRTRSVTLEDVAALYQAHASLAAQLNERMKARAQLSWPSAFQQEPPVPREPGFSLDPRFNESGLVWSLKSLATEPCRALDELNDKTWAAIRRLKHTQAWPGSIFFRAYVFQHDIEELRARCEALRREPYSSQLRKIATAASGLFTGVPEHEALEPLYTLKNELKDSTGDMDRFVWGVLNLAVDAHLKQCARYDGPLGGTRVGMNLFYTDLLAKLWALDVNNEAPGLRVPGFISIGRLPDSPFREEHLKKGATRLWFGPRKEAYTRSPAGAELRFQQVATRVFAAGSNADQLQGKESTPNENSRRALGWWDRHYADVADYEQEYHLQNQIMKWSVVTGFLHEKRLAPYLEQVPVSRTAEFDQWYEKHRGALKYQLPLVAGGGPSQECMYILSARSGLSGGVSLSGGKLAQVPVVKPTGDARLRHGLKAITGGEPVAKALGRALPEYLSPGVIQVAPLPTTTVRDDAVQLELGQVALVHARPQPGNYQLNLQASGTPAGSFHGVNTPERTTLRWQSQQMGDALLLAQKARSKDEAVLISVHHVKRDGLQGKPSYPWYAEVHGPEGQVQIPSAAGGDSTLVQISKAQVGARKEPVWRNSILADHEWQRLDGVEGAVGRNTSEGVLRIAVSEDPSLGVGSVKVTGLEDFPNGLDVVVFGSGEVYVRSPAEPTAFESWVNLDQSAAFTPQSLSKLREAARRGQTTISISELSRPQAELGVRALAGGDARGFTRHLQALEQEVGPELSRLEMRSHLQDAADLRLKRGNPSGAARLYELDRQHFGTAAPAVQIKATLADLATGRSGPKALEEVLAQHARRLSPAEGQRVLETTQGLSDMHDVTDVVRARMGFEGPIPQSVAPSIRLKQVGPEVVSSYPLQKPLPLEPLKPDEFNRGLPQDASIYVEDGFSFNKNDFQVNPAENLAELSRNPWVEVVRIQQLETGTYRPAQLVAMERPAQGAALERTYERVAGPREGDAANAPIYLIRHRHAGSCDTNKDGKVSEEESRLCKAA